MRNHADNARSNIAATINMQKLLRDRAEIATPQPSECQQALRTRAENAKSAISATIRTQKTLRNRCPHPSECAKALWNRTENEQSAISATTRRPRHAAHPRRTRITCDLCNHQIPHKHGASVLTSHIPPSLQRPRSQHILRNRADNV